MNEQSYKKKDDVITCNYPFSEMQLMVLFISKSNLISWFLVPDQTSFKSVEQFSRCSADLLPNMAENICLLS